MACNCGGSSFFNFFGSDDYDELDSTVRGDTKVLVIRNFNFIGGLYNES